MQAHALTVFGVEIPWDVRTLEGFRRWVATLDEHGPRVSFARGKVHVETSPQSYATHEALVASINEALRRLARELGIGRYFTPPSWFTHEGAALSTEPDGFHASWSTLEGGALRVNPERDIEMLGRPDMVLEVVSKTSERKDLVDHVFDYAAAGIHEYWIADARSEPLVFRVLVRGADGVYADSPPDADGWISSPLWQRRVRVRRLASRAGLPDFELEIEPVLAG
jgi:Uma2 family endonuclease